MRRATCVSCASEFPIGGMRLIENQRYCDSCANVKAASSMEGRGYALVDPTICTGCKADWGTTELSTVSKVFPYCDPCREKLYHYPFPKWLQGGLAFAFLLLVFALAHGAKYFRIGKDLYRGERQVQKKDYAGAVQSLAPVAEAAPECEKCVLLLAEAYLLSGQPDLAFAAAKKHQDGKFESGDLLEEVKPLFERANTAYDDMNEAGKQYENHQEQEAIKSINKAIGVYPEWQVPRQQAVNLQAGIAFDHKDYDKFLSLAEQIFTEQPKSSRAAAQVASALACKYAVTGEQNLRDQSESMLSRARELVTSKEDQQEFEEYAERISHRLKSREIITLEEYKRRFHPEAKQEVKK